MSLLVVECLYCLLRFIFIVVLCFYDKVCLGNFDGAVQVFSSHLVCMLGSTYLYCIFPKILKHHLWPISYHTGLVSVIASMDLHI